MGSGKVIEKKCRAVFLDRDGVIDKAVIRDNKPFPPNSVSEVIIPEGAEAALINLKAAGFLLIGITNQPDVARGTQSKEAVEEINDYLLSHLPVKEILVCYHDDSDNCDCRKPKPGLLIQAANKYHVDLNNSFMIGDRWRDIEAGLNAGCIPIFINFNYNEKQPSSEGIAKVASLEEASMWILKQ